MASQTWRTRWARRWESFSSSLLYVPTLVTSGAVLLFAVTSSLDAMLWPAARGAAPLGSSPWRFLLFGGSAPAASQLLGAIAGTWATIAGVVYSVTLVTIQLSATKYSAQVIPTFERDRLNQFVLGAFTGTFVYALLVLKTVRVADPTTFVPLIGVNVAVLAAVGSLFLLILFIGNLTAYIRPTRFVEDLSHTGIAALPTVHAPTRVQGFRPVAPDATEPKRDEGEYAVPLLTNATGYVREIRWTRLREALNAFAARAPDGKLPRRVEVAAKVGSRVDAGDTLITLIGEAPTVEKRLARDIQAAISVSPVRDVEHDPHYAAETLGDIAVTALSGGATDVGVAKASIRELLHLTSSDLRIAPPHKWFHATVEGDVVEVVRDVDAVHERCFLEVKRALDAAARRGMWDVAESFTEHARGAFLSAATADAATAWPTLRDWFRPVARTLFAFPDQAAKARMFGNMSKVARALRSAGHEDAAEALLEILVKEARAAGLGESAHAILKRELSA